MTDEVQSSSGQENAQTRNGKKGYPPGVSGNPAGRPKGARNKATILAETLLDSEAEAMRWYLKVVTAVQGDFDTHFADAQNNLGAMYANGEGVLQDYVQAHMWFNLGATRGNKKASKNRHIVAKRMTPADISKAQRLAREWLAKHGKK